MRSVPRPCPEAFGLAPSTVSRRYIRASARQLRALNERRLESYDLVAVLLDGKTFAEDEMVIVLGVTVQGHKVILGFVQTATENARVCAELLRDLVARGLRYEQGLLVVIDGSKGLRRGVQEVFGDAAAVQRCTWHKRENVVAHLPKGQQATWRQKLQRAYEQPTHTEAKAALDRLARELRVLNESAARSLAEGLDETLTLHRLGVVGELGRSFKTTNALESVMAQVEARTGKVDRWRTSDQKQRWLASALLDIEPRLRRVRGYRALPKLREALQRMLGEGGAGGVTMPAVAPLFSTNFGIDSVATATFRCKSLFGELACRRAFSWCTRPERRGPDLSTGSGLVGSIDQQTNVVGEDAPAGPALASAEAPIPASI